jgi:hypothetical protein
MRQSQYSDDINRDANETAVREHPDIEANIAKRFTPTTLRLAVTVEVAGLG